MNKYLAIDLGASSYRFILSDDEYNFEEIARFKDHLIKIDNKYVWDIGSILSNIIDVLKKIKNKNISLISLSINTWGCDFIEKIEDNIVYGNSYMQGITPKSKDNLYKHFSLKRLFDLTGINCQDFNTIYRVNDTKGDIVFIGSYIQYVLTGELNADLTIASTSQLLDKTKDEYNKEIVSKLQLENRLPKLIKPLSMIRPLKVIGLEEFNLVFGALHDTACAFYTANYDCCVVNVGSWVIVGINEDEVKSFNNEYNYERGAKNKYKIVKNIIGMNGFNKLIQELNISISYDELADLLYENNHDYIIDLEDYIINDSLKEYLESKIISSNKIINSNKIKVNNILEENYKYFLIVLYLNSLKEQINLEVNKIVKLSSKNIKKVYLIGGGIQNDFLLTKILNSFELEVVIGNPEATVLGNVMIQQEVNKTKKVEVYKGESIR